MPFKKKIITDEEPPEPLSAEEDRLLQTQDGVLAVYIAQNKKLNQIAKAINNYTLKLDGEDKGFERWHKVSTTFEALAGNLEYLKGIVTKQYGLEKLTEETLQSSNVLEDMLNNKRRKKK